MAGSARLSARAVLWPACLRRAPHLRHLDGQVQPRQPLDVCLEKLQGRQAGVGAGGRCCSGAAARTCTAATHALAVVLTDLLARHGCKVLMLLPDNKLSVRRRGCGWAGVVVGRSCRKQTCRTLPELRYKRITAATRRTGQTSFTLTIVWLRGEGGAPTDSAEISVTIAVQMLFRGVAVTTRSPQTATGVGC